MIQDDQPISEGLKVLDFGLAKIKSGELLGSFVQAKTSGLMGSPFYMAPEQWSDEEPDVRADIYSLGVILYQMLAGEVPFRGSNIPSIMKKHLTMDPPPLSSFGVEVAPEIEAALFHALEKEASHRPPTVLDFVEEYLTAVENADAVSSAAKTMMIAPPETSSNAGATPSMSSIGTHDSVLYVHSFPPSSRVFINNVSVGTTNESGDLVVREMVRGEHQVLVLHDGFREWRQNVDFHGGEYNIQANLMALDAGPVGQVSSGALGASSLNDLAFNPDMAALERQRREQEERARLAAEAAAQNRSISGQVLETSVANFGQNPEYVQDGPLTRLDFPVEPIARSEGHVSGNLGQGGTSSAYVNPQTSPEVPGSGTGGHLAPQTYVEPQQGGLGQGSFTGTYAGSPNYTGTGAQQASYNQIPGNATIAEAPPVVTIPPVDKKSKKGLIITLVAVLLVAAAGGGTWAFFHFRSKPNVVVVPPQNPGQNGNNQSAVKAEMVQIPGGTFRMGKTGGPSKESPEHAVTVQSFWMDKTEVTNAEYSEFLKATNSPPPAGWTGNEPLQGREQWPVSNVSFNEAKAFAQWRSKRDSVTYRLPTESEWEYAARNGADDQEYPWGNQFNEQKANLGTKIIKPIGSFPAGANKWGVQDLIGNVWEWTATPIEIYPGNSDQIAIPADQKTWMVIRGGSFGSDATGEKAVTAVTRQWVEPSRKDALLGFRLARSGQ